MKKTICFVLIISLVYSSILQVYASDHLGSLSYWYSSSGTIYHWNATSRQIYCNNISGIGSSSFPFLTSIQYGASLWSASVNLSLSTNTTNSSSPIYFYGGDQTSVCLLDSRIDYVYGRAGVVKYYGTYEGFYTYGTTSKNCYVFSLALGAVYYIAGKTENQYKNTASHEIGHAIGWNGHGSSSNMIMYSSNSSVITLSTNDVLHIAQMY